MSKALQATCSGGSITVGGVTISGTILTKGVGDSSGLVLIDRSTVTYVTSNTTDIEAMIDKLGEIIDKIVTIETGIDAASNSPGGQTANIALLVTLKTELLAQKEGLK